MPTKVQVKAKGKGRGRGRPAKTSCRSSERVRERNKNRKPSPTGQTLQSVRDQTYNLKTSRPIRESRKRIDYFKLNDGLDSTEKPDLPSPKRAKRSPIPARSGPSTDRMSARSPVNEKLDVPKSKLTGGTSDELIGDTELIGETVPPGNHTADGGKQNNDTLPDLVVNSGDTIPVTTDPTRHDISLDPGYD